MDDNISTFLYIIIGIIYFVYTILKKSKKQQRPGPPAGGSQQGTTDDGGQPTKRRPTFEELLREFTEDQSPPPRQEAVEDTYVEEEPYEEEVVDYDDPKYASPYADLQNMEAKSIEEMYGESVFKDTVEEKQVTTRNLSQEIRDMLQDPEGIKKAIIANEILNPKYF